MITFTVASLLEIIIFSPLARAESKNMNQENCNGKHTNSKVEQAISGQTQREVLDYWTPERMQNAKPLILRVPDDAISVPEVSVEEPSEPSISAPGSDVNIETNKQH